MEDEPGPEAYRSIEVPDHVRELLQGALRANRIAPFTEVRVVIGSGPGLFVGYEQGVQNTEDYFLNSPIRVGDMTWSPSELSPQQGMGDVPGVIEWIERHPPRAPARIPIASPISDEAGSWLRRQHVERMSAAARLALPKERPEVLFHYTDARGLTGMVSGQKVWLSHAWFLNDETEVSHGAELVASKLLAVARDESEGLYREVAAASLLNWRTRDLAMDPLVACFSESGDLESQWTRYADGQGFSIGLGVADLPSTHMGIRKVIYQPNEQSSAIDQVIGVYRETVAECVSAFGEDVARACVPAISSWLLSSLLFHSIAFKSPAWESEQEWRIVFMQPRAGLNMQGVQRHALKFRVTDRGIVPYLEFPLLAEGGAFDGRLPIREVYVGKDADLDLKVNGLVRLLSEHGYNSSITVIRPSGMALPEPGGKQLAW